MNWLYYLLEANLYLAVFYAFYRMFLHQETFYSLNRYYLITATTLSFILPVLQIGYLNNIFFGNQESTMVVASVVYQKRAVPAASSQMELSSLLYGVYLAIALGFLVKMLFTLSQIFRIYFQSKRRKIDSVTLIELQGEHAAFSFFNILFINPNLNQKETILKHEMVHINQRHSADVLFFEIVQVISWFNPILYFLKRDIKLLHEYLADEQTTVAGIEKHEYALFLIQHSFGAISNTLSNQIFNESLLKRRIKMLNKQKSGALAKFRLFLLVPVATSLLCVSTMAFTKDYGVIDLLPEQAITKVQDTGIKKHVFESHRGGASKKANDHQAIEKRVVVVNGRAILSNNNFDAVVDFDHKKELSPARAVKKYGDHGRFGAVELTGPNTTVVTDSRMVSAGPGKPAVPAPLPPLYKKLPGEKPAKNVIIDMTPASKKQTSTKSSVLKTQTTASQASVPAPKAITIVPIKAVTMPQQSVTVKGMTAMRSPKSNLIAAFGVKPTAVNDTKTVSSVTFIRRADADERQTFSVGEAKPQITRIKITGPTSGNTFHTAGPDEAQQIANSSAIKEIEFKLQSTSIKVAPAPKDADPIKTINIQQ